MKNFQVEDLLGRNPIMANNPKIREKHISKSILITGGAGSIGSELVRQICELEPKKVVIFDQGETALNDLMLEISEKYPNIKVDYILGDVSNRKKVEHILSQNHFDIVYHAAAYKHVPMVEKNPTEGVLVNILGTKNLAELSIKYGVERFVMISTDKAVNPVSVMGATKRVAELLVQSLQNKHHKTDFVITRFGNVLASNGSVLLRFQKQIEEQKSLTITHSEMTRYFMSIAESCQLVLEAGAIAQGGEICVFDMGEPIKIVDLAKKMMKIYDVDLDIKYTGLREGDKLYEELYNDKIEHWERKEGKIVFYESLGLDLQNIAIDIDNLIQKASDNIDNEVIAQLKTILPEYQNV